MIQVEIKKATLSDINELRKISEQTFIETFSEMNTPENMNDYVLNYFNIAQLTSELENPDSQFYLATYQSETIGYLKLNFGKAQTESGKDNSVEIHRIYVSNSFHGKKIGQLLLDQALKIAQQESVDYVWLGVWENNYRALRFYTKNGFVAFDKHAFVFGDEVQTDLLMKYTFN